MWDVAGNRPVQQRPKKGHTMCTCKEKNPETQKPRRSLGEHLREHFPDALGVLQVDAGTALVAARAGLLLCRCTDLEWECYHDGKQWVCDQHCSQWSCEEVPAKFQLGLLKALS